MITDSELLRYIRGGIHKIVHFNYDGHDLKLRPLRSIELDDAKCKGYRYVTPKMAKLLLNIYIGKIDPTEMHDEYPVEMYENFDKYYREIEYWIVYHSMKDFMPSDFSIDDVRKMRYVHDIAKKVLSTISSDSETITRVLYSDEGKEIVRLITIFNVPLATINDLTPLQEEVYYQLDPSKKEKKVKVKDMEELDKLLSYVGGGNVRRIQ